MPERLCCHLHQTNQQRMQAAPPTVGQQVPPRQQGAGPHSRQQQQQRVRTTQGSMRICSFSTKKGASCSREQGFRRASLVGKGDLTTSQARGSCQLAATRTRA